MAGLELKLISDISREKDNLDPSSVYDGSSKFYAEVDGQRIPYVRATKKFLEENANESKIGYEYGDEIFVDPTLNPAQLPFAVLMLHYFGAGLDPLRKRLGIDSEQLSSSDIRAIVIAAALTKASEVLRAEDMKDLIDRVRTDSDYDFEVCDPVIGDIVGEYSVTIANVPPGALVRRVEESLRFYATAYSKFVDAHRNNKYVRASRVAEDLRESYGPNLNTIDVSYAERAFRAIVGDKRFKGRVADVLTFVSELAKLPPGTELEVGRDESGILYLCQDVFSETKKPMVKFIGAGSSPQSNKVLLSGHAKAFFTGLRTRLMDSAFTEKKKLEHLLEETTRTAILLEAGDEPTLRRVQEQLLIAPKQSGEPTTAITLYAQERNAVAEIFANLTFELNGVTDDLTTIATGGSSRILQLTRKLREIDTNTAKGVSIDDANDAVDALVEEGYNLLNTTTPTPELPGK